MLDELEPETLPSLDTVQLPGPHGEPETPIMSSALPEGWTLHQHGLVKGAMMLLGLPHHHEGDDLVVSAGWEALLEGLGFSFEGDRPLRTKNAQHVAAERIHALRQAKEVLDEERARKGVLEKERATIRIAAETGARQRGLGIAETDQVGRDAAASVPDEGPRDPAAYLAAQRLEDEHAVEGIMVLVRSSQTFDGNTVRPSASAAEWGV